MTQDEARKTFWELKAKIDAGKALRKPFQDARNELAFAEAKLRADVKECARGREAAMSSEVLGGMERELADLARYLRGKVGVAA